MLSLNEPDLAVPRVYRLPRFSTRIAMSLMRGGGRLVSVEAKLLKKGVLSPKCR